MIEYQWRITKYNPAYRSKQGCYTNNEWTSFYDVGKNYSGRVFAIEEYLQVEEKYVNAIINLMLAAKVPYLVVRNLYKWEQDFKFMEYYSNRMIKLYNCVKNGYEIQGEDLREMIKLVLRENLGCQLFNNSNMYVHFGYDYYMYVGTNNSCSDTLEEIRKDGLFVEQCKSPYLNIDNSNDE